MSDINPEQHKYPVFHTQGGGLVMERRDGGVYRYYFILAPPSVPSLLVGDEMPNEWDIQPANAVARRATFVLGKLA